MTGNNAVSGWHSSERPGSICKSRMRREGALKIHLILSLIFAFQVSEQRAEIVIPMPPRLTFGGRVRISHQWPSLLDGFYLSRAP